MAAAMKHIASNFAKLEKFEGVDFRRWQKKMYFFLSIMSVVYVLTTLIQRMVVRIQLSNKLGKGLNRTMMIMSAEVYSSMPKGNNVVGPLVVNMVEHNNSSRKPGHLKKDCKAGNIGNRANGSCTKGSEDGSSNPLKGTTSTAPTARLPILNPGLRVWVCRAVVRTPNLKLKTLVKEALNASLLDMLSIPRLLVVSERVTDEIVQQSEPELRKSKRHRTPKDFRPEFQLYLIEGTRDEVQSLGSV
ncbi:hypothetical protein Tco_0482315 [Tanacetum coccineum]